MNKEKYETMLSFSKLLQLVYLTFEPEISTDRTMTNDSDKCYLKEIR